MGSGAIVSRETSSVIDEQRAAAMQFEPEEMARYSRHLIIPEVGDVGQRHLKASRVLCIGAGGLGSPSALYLASAGVGTLGLIDPDVVDLSNLQRQLLHGTRDVGRKKLDSARERIADTNPHVDVELHDAALSSNNAREIVASYDVVIDGSDNFPTRYLSNDVCVFLKKPNIYGSVFRFDGQATVFAAHLGGPCYRCLFPEPPPPGAVPSCAEAGVLGVLPGVIGMLQAIECIKLLLGVGDSLIGRLLHFDALALRFREFHIRRDPLCPVCGENPTIFEPIDYEQFCGNSAAASSSVPSVNVRQLKAKMDASEPFVLVDVREPFEYDISRINGSRLIPLAELPARLSDLDVNSETILQCKSGVRSARAVQILQQAGFGSVYNLEGGIDAWADEIDPTLQKY
jgi:adenylyltransferase/sulfurtransferase